MEQVETIKCYSKFDQKFLYLVGYVDEYRKFMKTNEHGENIYLECISCKKIKRDNNLRFVITKNIKIEIITIVLPGYV